MRINRLLKYWFEVTSFFTVGFFEISLWHSMRFFAGSFSHHLVSERSQKGLRLSINCAIQARHVPTDIIWKNLV
jgi:hypothetical protein